VTAQEATPAPLPSTEPLDDTSILFVQIAAGGNWTPNPGYSELFTLTLDHAVAQTIYFSDRPERIVGTVSTRQFLDNLGFTTADPPNAALVAQTGEGEAVVVVELFAPRYEETFGDAPSATLTYNARVLANYSEEGLSGFAAQQSLEEFPEAFESASLFIDDCADKTFFCGIPTFGCVYGDIGKHGMCWHASTLSCRACDPDAYTAQCNEAFPNCAGHCTARHLDDDGDGITFLCPDCSTQQYTYQCSAICTGGGEYPPVTSGMCDSGDTTCIPCLPEFVCKSAYEHCFG
jgi:hypothetical protein